MGPVDEAHVPARLPGDPRGVDTASAFHLADGTWPAQVIGAVRVELAPTRDAPAAARRAARTLLQERASPAEIIDVVLLMSELVTNAVLHASLRSEAPIVIHLAIATERLRAEVRDGGAGFGDIPPRPEPADRLLPDGRGLPIVEAVASRWGTSTSEAHCVWFEVDRRAPGGAG